MKKNLTNKAIITLAISGFIFWEGCASGKHEDLPTPETAPFVSNITANPVPVAVEVASDLTQANNLGHGKTGLDGVKAGGDPNAPSAQDAPPNEEDQKKDSAPNTTKNDAKKSASRKTASTPSAGEGKTMTYVVQPGDTLMKIAFEHLGDLLRWREIYADNKEKIVNINSLQKGTTLTIHVTDPVTVTRNGDPYSIRRGDTLGKISNWIYGTVSQWKRLWENNKELIHNPNRMYVGFRLYFTMTPEERENFKKRQQQPQIAPNPLAQAAPAPQKTIAAAPATSNPIPVPVPVPVQDARAPASAQAPASPDQASPAKPQ